LCIEIIGWIPFGDRFCGDGGVPSRKSMEPVGEPENGLVRMNCCPFLSASPTTCLPGATAPALPDEPPLESVPAVVAKLSLVGALCNPNELK
jgi:hypothetical protein